VRQNHPLGYDCPVKSGKVIGSSLAPG